MDKDLARFLSHVGQHELVDQCWIWTASKSNWGYGRFKYRGQMGAAHRWIYEYFYGEIAEGLQIDHLCRNRLCVNPMHLEAVTNVVNSLRGDLYNRNKTHCKQGHEFTVDNTLVTKNLNGVTRRTCRICAKVAKQKFEEKTNAIRNTEEKRRI